MGVMGLREAGVGGGHCLWEVAIFGGGRLLFGAGLMWGLLSGVGGGVVVVGEGSGGGGLVVRKGGKE